MNHKRVYRLYRLEGLSLRLKSRRKRPSHLRMASPVAQAPDEHWSLNFITDSLADGRRFRALTFVDNMSRESPAIEVDRSLSGQWVVAVLERLASTHGLPKTLFVDNGPEVTPQTLDAWAHRHGVQLAFSRPGTPTDNPFIEAFNARFREECFNQHWFGSLKNARTPIEAWRVQDHPERPHTALGHQVPARYTAHWLQTPETRTARDEP